MAVKIRSKQNKYKTMRAANSKGICNSDNTYRKTNLRVRNSHVFVIVMCSINTGKINKDFLHCDYLGFRFVQGSVLYRIPFYSGFGLDMFRCTILPTTKKKK